MWLSAADVIGAKVVAVRGSGLSGNPPTRAHVSADRFGRHDSEDRFMVAAAKLAFDLVLPTEASGKNVLALPDQEERWVRRLYERAVGGFFEVVLSPKGWQVTCGSTLSWQIKRRTTGIDKMILPMMRTDVVAKMVGLGTGTVRRIKQEMDTV
jgi:5-methylcytosine-specific restriction enzyme subunit McrC